MDISLADLSNMGVVDFEGNVATRGSNFGIDNGPWLNYTFLNDLIADTDDASPVRGDQCDSCSAGRLSGKMDHMH